LEPKGRTTFALLSDNLREQLEPARYGAMLAGALGLLALALASIGMSGVFAYMVRQRTREIGLRTALGAHPAQVVRLVLGSNLRALAWGLAISLGGALAATRLLPLWIPGQPQTEGKSGAAPLFAKLLSGSIIFEVHGQTNVGGRLGCRPARRFSRQWTRCGAWFGGIAVSGKASKRHSDGGKLRPWFRVGFGSFRFYLALIVVAVVLHFITAVVGSMTVVVPHPAPEVANEFMKKQLDIWAEMNKLLIALATLAIGAIGGLLMKNEARIQPRQARRAAAGWIFCALSLYFGYLSYQQAASMLSIGAFDSHSPRIWWPTQAQFWAFIVSVILFADLVYGSTQARRESRNEIQEDKWSAHSNRP
jgi:hypothetical protein